MTNKERALETLYYRIESLAGNFVKETGEAAEKIARKINVYGRLKEVLEAEVAKEAAEKVKFNQPAYTNKIDSTTSNNFGW